MGIPLERKIEQIEALKAIVDGRGDASRLFELLIRFCLESQNDYTDGERETFGDILVRFMPTLDVSKKVEISNQFAHLERAPTKIIRYLALDVIVVARPILSFSPVLVEEDLLVVSRMRGYEHMLAICVRKEISIQVAAELVKCGNEMVWTALLKNKEAKISDKSFLALRKHALQSYPVLYGLLDRKDIPDRIIRQVVLEAGETIRDYLKQNSYYTFLAYLDEALKKRDSGKTGEKENPLDELQRLFDHLRANGVLSRLKQSDFRAAVLDDDTSKITCMFSHMTGLGLEESMRLLGGRDLDPVMLACKAIRLRPDTVDSLLKSGSWKINLTTKRRQQLLDGYEKLNPKIARNVLKMRVNLSK